MNQNNESIAESLIELARCSKRDRIIVAGPNAPEIMFELNRRGYVRVATTAQCGLPRAQYHVAMVDWETRSLKSLETTLDWLRHFLARSAVLVIRTASDHRGELRKLDTLLTGLGMAVEIGRRTAQGILVAARQREPAHIKLAA